MGTILLLQPVFEHWFLLLLSQVLYQIQRDFLDLSQLNPNKMKINENSN
jgi:hypothetical protein